MVCFTSGQKRNEDVKTKLAKIVMSIDSILLNGVKHFNGQQVFNFYSFKLRTNFRLLTFPFA